MSLKESKTFLNLLNNITPKYEYKGKEYCILSKSKFKSVDLDLIWIDCIIYMCCYENEDGMIWVRPVDEFYRLFKQIDEEQESK